LADSATVNVPLETDAAPLRAVPIHPKAALSEVPVIHGIDAGDDWNFGQGGFRMDWDRSEGSRVSLQGDVYRGRISQPSAGDVAVSGGNLNASWSHTISANSDVRARLYYDRTNRDIPSTFGEHLDTYDVDLQHHTRLGTSHDVVWGLGYLLINERVANRSALPLLPEHVARQ